MFIFQLTYYKKNEVINILENTPFWTSGTMKLWVNNQPAKVYVPPENPKQTYKKLQSKLSKEGSIPIGIDHLPDNLMKANPILAKLNLLDVGEITKIQYTDDTIKIVEAKLTNPLIQELYENGELDMVSIVANSTTSECPRGDYDYIIDTTDITRVDIVEKGACHECNIPQPTDYSDTVVYARYSITEEEANNMANGLTKEEIKTIFDECIDEKLKPVNEQIDAIIKASEPPVEPNPADGKDDDEIKKMEAEIAELKAKTATAKVENLIASGKILPADKETHVELCAREPEIFDKLMENAPVLIDLNTKKSLFARDADDDDEELTPEEENLQNVMAHFGDE